MKTDKNTVFGWKKKNFSMNDILTLKLLDPKMDIKEYVIRQMENEPLVERIPEP